MNQPASLFALSIAAVERDTGLSKDTLRVWERRYGFPQPLRDASDERTYPPEQVERLRLIARLLGCGQRPGRVVALPLATLQQRVQDDASTHASPADLSPEQAALLATLKSHDVLALRRSLHQCLLRMGLGRFISELLAPMNILVGEAWMRGEIQVFEEHLYTECVTGLLHSAIGNLTARPTPERPRVLLTTLPQEAHALGLLMAEAFMTLEGCECISLGVETPLAEIVQAASANRVQVVALSFSTGFNGKQLLRGLDELRAKLPATTALWAGGANLMLKKHVPAGVTPLPTLAHIAPLVAQYSADWTAPGSSTRPGQVQL